MESTLKQLPHRVNPSLVQLTRLCLVGVVIALVVTALFTAFELTLLVAIFGVFLVVLHTLALIATNE